MDGLPSGIRTGNMFVRSTLNNMTDYAKQTILIMIANVILISVLIAGQMMKG